MPVRFRCRRVLVSVSAVVLALGCSMSVPAEEVYGTYVAVYPFGAEMLTLFHDGTFVQQITVEGQSPEYAKGSWSLDPQRSRVTLSGLRAVVDGFDNLRSDWRTEQPGISSMDVERHWFKIVMGSARGYPYLKR